MKAVAVLLLKKLIVFVRIKSMRALQDNLSRINHHHLLHHHWKKPTVLKIIWRIFCSFKETIVPDSTIVDMTAGTNWSSN